MSARTRHILAVLHLVVAVALLVALLAGCSTSPPERVQTRVPVPVACQETVPARPVMPTEALVPGVLPWTLLRAALAEIDRREGYEVQLRAALISCTTHTDTAATK